MSMLPIALYWMVALWGLGARKPVLLWLFFVSLPFGSMVVVPTGLTAGLSLLPATMTAMLIIVREMVLRRGGFAGTATVALRGSGLILFVFWCACVIITLCAPRLFAGQVDVVPMSVAGFLKTEPLAPTLQNISQLAYVTVSVFSVFCFARIFASPSNRNLLIRGMMLAGTITIVTGLLDLSTTYLPVAPLLEPFRTAQYAILDSVTIAGGVKRVTGLMPEASAFGGLSMVLLSALWFLRRALTQRRDQRRALWVIAGLTVMLVLSTSSAGYVGIAVLLGVIGLEWAARAGRLQGSSLMRRGLRAEFLVALFGLAGLIFAIIVAPQIFEPVIERLNALVFTKTESLSFIERSFWTRTSFEAGLSTYGIGAGLGSVRASNYVAALFGSTGILGVGLYFWFVARRLLGPISSGDPRDQAVASALKWSFFPPFAVSLLIGTTPDFGTFEALRWGVLLALATTVSQKVAPHQSKRAPTVLLRSRRSGP